MSLKHGRHRRLPCAMRIVSSVVAIIIGLVAMGISGAAYAGGNDGVGENSLTSEDCTWNWNRSIPQEHTEYKYKKEVIDEKTQWYFVKYTRIKTRTWVEGEPATPDQWWNWSPNNTQGPQDYEPAFPTDPRGTWQGPHNNGGPQQNTYGTFKTGSPGNSNWFHREHGTPGVAGHWSDWSDFGPWERWSPDTHTSWQDNNVEALGQPAFHASGTYQDGTQWYREWQVRNTGETRVVETGSTWEYSDWTTDELGDPWVKVDERSVQDDPIVQGPVRSANEPDRGDYPDVPWVKDGESKVCPPAATPVEGSVTFNEGSVVCVNNQVVYTNPTYVVAGNEHVVYDTTRGEHTAEFGQPVVVNATSVDNNELYQLIGQLLWSHTFGAKPEAPAGCEVVPPVNQCPDGTNPGDLNGDGVANEADCGYVPPSAPTMTVTALNEASCSVQTPEVRATISDTGSLGIQPKGGDAVDWQLTEVAAGAHKLTLDKVKHGQKMTYRVVYSPLDDSGKRLYSGWLTFKVPANCGGTPTPTPTPSGAPDNPTFGTGAGMPTDESIMGSGSGSSALWALAGMMGGLLLIMAGGGSLVTLRRRDGRG
ncbi:MAG TPA: hypothetical protein VGE34_04655 [Candidatus Saccharimonadales bacterium]